MTSTHPHAPTTEEPATIPDVDALEERLSRPDDDVIADLARIDGDILVLGAGGKMGPTLARMAKRAAPDKTIYAVARFSDASGRGTCVTHGVETVKADLLDREPAREAARGAQRRLHGRSEVRNHRSALADLGDEHATSPALVAEAMAESRIVAFSTGCVYPFVPVDSGGSTEDSPLTPPGEYANSCVGRERILQLVLGETRHAGPPLPAELRDRPPLRRAARRARARSCAASPST